MTSGVSQKGGNREQEISTISRNLKALAKELDETELQAVLDYSSRLQPPEELRAPEGCPWDRKQTPSSLINYLIEEVHELAEAIEEETDRTLARLDEFLMLSRPAPLRSEPLDLRELLDGLAELLVPDLETKHARLEVRGEPVTVSADRDQTRREIYRHSPRDADAYDRFGQLMYRMALAVKPILGMVPPDPTSLSPRDLRGLLRLGKHFRELGEADFYALAVLVEKLCGGRAGEAGPF